jgi:hypothetical protein
MVAYYKDLLAQEEACTDTRELLVRTSFARSSAWRRSGPLVADMSVVFEVTTRRGRERVREVFTGRRVSGLSPEEAARARQAGYELSGVDDWLIGRDPRKMTQAELRAMGHEPMSPMGAIRARYLRLLRGQLGRGSQVHRDGVPQLPVPDGQEPVA